MAAGIPHATIGFARFPRGPSKGTCLESDENAKFRVGNQEPPTPATPPIALEASAPGLEDPPGPRLTDGCIADEEIRLQVLFEPGSLLPLTLPRAVQWDQR